MTFPDPVAEATAKLHDEATFLRDAIRAKEVQLEKELAPVRAQLEQIENAIARIEGRPSRTPSGRAPRGHNRHAILRHLSESDGATAREISDATAISSATMFATLAKFEKDGLVKKRQSARGVTHWLTARGREAAS